MRTRLPALVIALPAVVLMGFISRSAIRQSDVDRGKAAYVDAGCARCHSVESHDIQATAKSERLRGPDLGQIGSQRDSAWIIAYLKREVTIDDKQHRSKFRGDVADLPIIAEWLAQLETRH